MYSCIAANVNGTVTSSLRFIVKQGSKIYSILSYSFMDCDIPGAPMLLRNNNIAPGANCQNRQIKRDGVIQAMLTGYPTPAVTWFRDVKRTSRIVNDSIYQLLPSGDVSIDNYMIFTLCT